MVETSKRSPGTILAVVLLVLLSAADVFVLLQLSAPGAAEALAQLRSAAENGRASAALSSALETGMLPWLLIPTLTPLVIAVIAFVGGRGRAAAVAPTAVEVTAEKSSKARKAEKQEKAPPAPPAIAPEASALKLLATLQEEARLIDFVREDVSAYTDAQVGAAVRGIHAALRKSLDERLEIEPILTGEEGDPVDVPADMPAGRLRLTGRAAGAPPVRGVLRHGGWRATTVRLPAATPGSDPSVLAPAEVEVGEE
jgi:hypothetical protein